MQADSPPPILKYPRTVHLEGSSIQKGDDDVRVVLSVLRGQGDFVWEEKVDGANSGFRFDGGGNLLLQSRGRYLDAQDRNANGERDWTLLKDWMRLYEGELLDRLEDRYLVYSEWMQVAHSVHYDRLPSLMMEFDVFDLARDGAALATDERRKLLAGLPIASVPVVKRGYVSDLDELESMIRPSLFRTPGREVLDTTDAVPWSFGPTDSAEASLRRACAMVGDDFDRRLPLMDTSGLMEGLYLKVERDGVVVGRYKWVRPGFTQVILDADEHWASRFPVPNLLEAPTEGFPVHLARTRDKPPVAYDPDDPFAWGPWARPEAISGSRLRR